MKVGGWSNDLDKNNCAVIIIKTVFGHRRRKREHNSFRPSF